MTSLQVSHVSGGRAERAVMNPSYSCFHQRLVIFRLCPFVSFLCGTDEPPNGSKRLLLNSSTLIWKTQTKALTRAKEKKKTCSSFFSSQAACSGEYTDIHAVTVNPNESVSIYWFLWLFFTERHERPITAMITVVTMFRKKPAIQTT